MPSTAMSLPATLSCEPGCFAIFFPEDAHAPIIGNGITEKPSSRWKCYKQKNHPQKRKNLITLINNRTNGKIKAGENGPYLKPYENQLYDRYKYALHKETELTQGTESLSDFATGYLYWTAQAAQEMGVP